MSYGDAPDKVLESTCSCGATFKVIAQHPLRYYSKWLEQHRDHTAPQSVIKEKEVGDGI